MDFKKINMISLPIDIRKEFEDKVKNFCVVNNIEWGIVNSECWLEGAIGTSKDIKMVEDYIESLEQERQQYRNSESFWWRLWN
jgi:hypothetical protein